MQILKKPELLSPAGSFESLKAAVNGGCDAVYLGGKQFSARQFAGNFSLEELKKACDFCHLRDVKVFVTVNTVYKDSELSEFLNFVNSLYSMGCDALIIQDIGAASLVKKYFPDFELHASTQLTANSLEDVKFFEGVGFKRVVLSRELSIEEIKNITFNTNIEIETFIHGALCVSYSGQCIMSSMIGGRSGNRGRCAQTCRLPYELYKEDKKIIDGHLLSPKDMHTIMVLSEVIESGIDSFKIEGRMKSPEYVAGVTEIYRKYIDMYINDKNNYKVDLNDIKILNQLFNRGGFSDGYYNTHSGKNMMCVERPKHWGLKTGFIDSYDQKHEIAFIRTRENIVPGDGIEIWTQNEPHVGTNLSKQSKAGEVIKVKIKGDINKNEAVYKTFDKVLMDRLKRYYIDDWKKKSIKCELKLKIGEHAQLKFYDDNNLSVQVEGNIVEEAKNQPILKEKLIQQVGKLGNTPFNMQEISIIGDNNIYIDIKSINELRREATQKFCDVIIEKSRRKKAENLKISEASNDNVMRKKKLNVLVNTMEQFDTAVKFDYINILYFEINKEFEKNIDYCINKCKENNIKIFAAMPRIYRKYTENIYGEFIENLKNSEIDGFLIRSFGELYIVKDCKKSIISDFNFNVFNRESVKFLNSLNMALISLSPELNLNEINSLSDNNCEMVIYGYLPLMTTHQCPIGNYDGNKENKIYCSNKNLKENYYIKDRKNMNFFIMTDCDQCVCTILNGKALFTLKFFDEILESKTGYARLIFTKENAEETQNILNMYIEAMEGKRGFELKNNETTKGHYFRGVE